MDNPEKTTEGIPDKKPSATKDKLSLLVFILLAAFLLSIFQYIAPNNVNIGFVAVVKWVFLYFGLQIFLSLFDRYKFVRNIQLIVLIPGALLEALSPIVASFGAIFIAYIFAAGASTIVLISTRTFLFHCSYQYATMVYIVLTATSIIMTTFGDKIVQKWHAVQSEKDKDYYHQLSLRLLDQKKSRYLMFGIYFILLIVFNIASFNGTPLFGDDKITTAILQSFATYIAFDRLQTNWSSISNQKDDESKGK